MTSQIDQISNAATMRTLIHTKTRKPVSVGDALVSFRGEKATLTFIPKRGNKVCVKWEGEADFDAEYYPSVFNIEYVEG